MSKKKPSWVWNHCTKSADGSSAVCNVCGATFSTKSSTTTLIRHLENMHNFEESLEETDR